jgi:hypothetical protein
MTHRDAAIQAATAPARTPVVPGPLPELTCPHCGATAVPRIAAGAGPLYARASCGACGKFLRWLPKPRQDARSSQEREKG